MRLPRDTSGDQLIRTLERFGYGVQRQSGSHVRLRHPGPPAHFISVPRHRAIKPGTLHGILSEVSRSRSISLAALIEAL